MISVIVTTYQRRAPLAKALASVFAQAAAELEVIVVDDGSTDGTIESIRTQPVTAVSLPHSGNPAVTRNAGLTQAAGDLIAFLDSDDVWRPTALAELAAALDAQPEAGFAYCDYEPPLSPAPPLPLVGDVFDQLLDVDFIMTSGLLVRRSVVDAVGTFDPQCRLAEDWDYWLRMAARFPAVHVAHRLLDIGAPADSLSRAPGGAIYGMNIRVMRKALDWCLRHRRASVPLARRAYRRSLIASARYHWHTRAIRRTMRDLVTVALAR